MKHLLTILISLVILTLFFAGLPVKFALSSLDSFPYTGIAKNRALLTQVILDEYGDRGLCRLLHSMHERQNGSQNGFSHFVIYCSFDSTFTLKKEDIVVPKLDGYKEWMAECLNDANFLDVIREAIMRKSNDTIFYQPQTASLNEPFRLLKESKSQRVMLWLLLPNNFIYNPIQDTTAWEQAALQDLKNQIHLCKNHPVKVLMWETEIPDSLKNLYKLYMNNTL